MRVFTTAITPLVLCRLISAQEIAIVGDAQKSELTFSELRELAETRDEWELPMAKGHFNLLDLGTRDAHTVELIVEGLMYLEDAPKVLVIHGRAVNSESIPALLSKIEGLSSLIVTGRIVIALLTEM